jgi:hypothetical protein
VRVTNRVKFAALTVRYLAFKAEQGRAVVGNCSFRIQANVWRTAKPVHFVLLTSGGDLGSRIIWEDET